MATLNLKDNWGNVQSVGLPDNPCTINYKDQNGNVRSFALGSARTLHQSGYPDISLPYRASSTSWDNAENHGWARSGKSGAGYAYCEWSNNGTIYTLESVLSSYVEFAKNGNRITKDWGFNQTYNYDGFQFITGNNSSLDAFVQTCHMNVQVTNSYWQNP